MQRTCSRDFNDMLDRIPLQITLVLWQEGITSKPSITYYSTIGNSAKVAATLTNC